MKHPKRNPTEEELKNDKKTILELFKNGIPIRRMEAQLDMPKSYITKVRGMLITEGLITEEEIKSAYAEYLKNHPEEDPSLRKVTCEMCKGSGKVRYYYGESALEAFLDGYPDYEYGPCPNCEGKGYFFEKK